MVKKQENYGLKSNFLKKDGIKKYDYVLFGYKQEKEVTMTLDK